MRLPAERLADILRAIELIAAETESLDQRSFDERFGDGISPLAATVGFALIVIGEACAGLLREQQAGAPDLPARYSELDRKGFVKLRHVVAHQYFRVRADFVWGVVRDELPTLARIVRAGLARS